MFFSSLHALGSHHQRRSARIARQRKTKPLANERIVARQRKTRIDRSFFSFQAARRLVEEKLEVEMRLSET